MAILGDFFFLTTLTNPVSVICNFCNIYVFVFILKNVFNIKSLVTLVSHSKPWIALYLIASSGFRVKCSSDSPWQPTHGGRGKVENTGEIFGNNGWREASLVGQVQGCNA